jgi:hypothetical protein
LFLSERSVPRAPSRDGAVVAQPPLREVGAALAINRRRLDSCAERLFLLDRPFSELRRAARESAVGCESAPDTLLVAGHQPELFHPGVWVKNFALYGLAQTHHASALNLIVDNDIVKTTALRIPVLSDDGAERARTRTLLFDRWTGETPYEERTIADRELFASFAERVGELTRGWNFEPLLPSFWTEVLRQAERTPNLGECFAAARRTFERAWGCHNSETPLSVVCRTEPFAWFACHLLVHLPRFHALYNAIVADYRRRHGIRSRNHPVPDLAADGAWLEAPLWAWRAGAARRERLFVRAGNDGLELRAGEDRFRLRTNPQTAVSDWLTLESRGFKVRSRALTTTLYARLFLADLFIHGIGGGAYDELTDELMRRFYDCEPPLYLVLSATRWLPLPRAAVTTEDHRRLVRELRDVHYNPQRHLDDARPSAELIELAASKQGWIACQAKTAAERRERFHMLRTLTEQLRRPLLSREEQLRQQLLRCQRQLRSNAVLQRRDYSFCLFPADSLRRFCTQFLTAPDS